MTRLDAFKAGYAQGFKSPSPIARGIGRLLAAIAIGAAFGIGFVIVVGI